MLALLYLVVFVFLSVFLWFLSEQCIFIHCSVVQCAACPVCQCASHYTGEKQSCSSAHLYSYITKMVPHICCLYTQEKEHILHFFVSINTASKERRGTLFLQERHKHILPKTQ